jgi:putative glutamine amidotransferase
VAAILGEEVDVPSYHHQSVLTHPGYVASAWATDGTLEAMEMPDARFRLAVQWHPEVGTDPRLFDAFVAAAASTRRP